MKINVNVRDAFASRLDWDWFARSQHRVRTIAQRKAFLVLMIAEWRTGVPTADAVSAVLERDKDDYNADMERIHRGIRGPVR